MTWAVIANAAAEFWPVLIGAAGFAWGLFQRWAAKRAGRREAQAEQQDADQTAYIETRKEIDNAVRSGPDVRNRDEWLRAYNRRHSGPR